jgi:hypothetical protein
MSLQHQTKSVKLTYIMSRKSFVDGFNSIRKKQPFDYDSCDKDLRYGWSYERGRLLALVYDGDLKNGRYVTHEAIVAYLKAHKEGAIL